jgi:flavin-binding protein dodecin
LTPELVREAARPDDSPAHSWVFSVPVEQAAEQYYLDRAHDLIRRVRVTVIARSDGEPRRVRFFHAIPGEEAAYVYEPLDVIRRSPDKLAAARTEAIRRLRDAERSVEDMDIISSTVATTKAVKAIKRARELVSA